MKHKNELYPVFLKVNVLNVLIIGGGNTALEKLTFMLKSSPGANITLIAETIHQEIIDHSTTCKLNLINRTYDRSDPYGYHIVIAATNNKVVNHGIYQDCKRMNILVNVADVPEYCDFYLGGIVSKGQVKVAISTNGQSPTLAKRMRQYLENILPDEVDKLAKHLNQYRNSINADFKTKVQLLNKVTQSLIKNK